MKSNRTLEKEKLSNIVNVTFPLTQYQIETLTRKKADSLYKKMRNPSPKMPSPISSTNQIPFSKRFVSEASNFINSSFEDYTDEKESLLKKYFPRFRKNGNQSIDQKDYSPNQVGAIFKQIYNSYKK